MSVEIFEVNGLTLHADDGDCKPFNEELMICDARPGQKDIYVTGRSNLLALRAAIDRCLRKESE